MCLLHTQTPLIHSIEKPGTYKKSFPIFQIRPARALSELQYTFRCLKPKQKLYPQKVHRKMQPQKMPSAVIQKGTTSQLAATLLS